jgi:uncharacterized protein YndB with AHSA1/START domain
MVARAQRTVRHQYFLRASPTRVFRAISEPGELTRWLADDAELAPRKGGRYLLRWRDGPTHTGTVLEFVRGRRLTLSWEWEGIALKGTRFTLSVTPKNRGTLLEVKHTGFPAEPKWVDLLAGTEWGWTYFAMNLKSVLEQGHDLRSGFDG